MPDTQPAKGKKQSQNIHYEEGGLLRPAPPLHLEFDKSHADFRTCPERQHLVFGPEQSDVLLP